MNPLLSGLLWVLLTGMGLLVGLFPRRFELWLGPKLGQLFRIVDRRRRRIAWDNIRRCLPELGPRGWEKLLRQNYDHYGNLGLEIMHLFSPIPGHFRRYTMRWAVVDGFDNWRRAHAKGKGTIVVTAHLANWEMFGIGAVAGIPALMATRRLKPEWLHERVVAARLSIETRTAFGKRILPTLLKHLKEGRTVGFVLDQYAPPPMGVPVNFFGVKVSTQAAVGLLAQRTGAAIVPAVQWRDERGRIHAEFLPELVIPEDELRDPERSTQILAAECERWIRARPSQWLWVHRRFKNVTWPEESAAARTQKA